MNQTKWYSYSIMHSDRKVATIHSDGTVVIYYASFLPFDLYLENNTDLDTRLNNLNNFYYWLSRRMITLDRKYAKSILNFLGKTQAVTDQDRAQVVLSYHAVSLMDVYWVKGYREKLTYSQIDIRKNSLSNAFIPVALTGKQLTADNSQLNDADISSDLFTTGVAPKAWVRKKDGFYLLKDGDERDVKAELLASKIAQCFQVNQVIYQADNFDGHNVSSCKILPTEIHSLIPMESVEIYAANHDTDYEKFALKLDAYSYYMMNIIDYLIGNTDRHLGNWGVLSDNQTGKIISLYPLMDFNKAFTSYSNLEGSKCLTMVSPISQKEAALKAVSEIGLNQIKDIDPSWFDDEFTKEMFFSRLNVLKNSLS